MIFSLLNATLEDAERKYNASYHPLLESYEEYENVSKNRIPDRDSLDFARGIERGRGINYCYKPSSTDKYCLIKVLTIEMLQPIITNYANCLVLM